MEAVFETRIPGAKLLNRGKVRDLYDMGHSLAIVATDRISCFDVVLPTAIPDKGKILTQMSRFWFNFLQDSYDNHLASTTIASMPTPLCDHPKLLKGRTMLVHKCDVFPVECIVRGYLDGSGWKDYQQTGAICGIPLPAGLKRYSKLPQPIFTPSTKEEKGTHDQNIPFEEMERLIGQGWAADVRAASLAVYARCSKYALDQGVIIADTKFEWGLHNGKLTLVDEVMTPDSSRFWPTESYEEGEFAESFDKQFVRDWLETTDWDKRPPAPELPDDLVQKTRALYLRALRMITGEDLHA